jgi:serine/threonine-protein kinase
METEDTVPFPFARSLKRQEELAKGDWEPGTRVGRFVILQLLGEGGMGKVFAAHDPMLDRRIALKTLHTFGDGQNPAIAAHLVREAQAMARLQHPNVCVVHDIGTLEGRVFVAMELVDGSTLRVSMGERRPWREVLRLFIAAGRGLEAAHAAGLIHRDFKPENVLIGNDGRPRVSDFGLVSLFAGARPDEPSGRATLSRAGTPGYMSPEQMRGDLIDARSDQFSFCVALWEALTGATPFPCDAAPEERTVPARELAQVPRRLRGTLTRGLARRPEDRWPSMTALLDALGREPKLRRGSLRVVAAATLLVLAPAVRVTVARQPPADPCVRAGERLSGIWDAGVKGRLRAAFMTTRAPQADDAWQRTRAILDGYAQRWTATHEEACRATREGRQSDALLDLRMQCLDRRRATLATLTGLWSSSLDAAQVDRAASAASALENVDDCSDIHALGQPLGLPRDERVRQRIAAVRARMDRVRGLLANGNLREARAAAEALQSDADASDYLALQAEAKLLLGEVLDGMDDAAAATPLDEAARLAARAHDDQLAARALIVKVRVLSNYAAQFERALGLVPAASAFVARAGDPPALRGSLSAVQAGALLDAGKAEEAKDLLVPALPLLERTFGRAAPQTLAAATTLAGVANQLGDYETARETCNQLLTAKTQLHGPSSPEVAAVLEDLGMVEEGAGRYDVARDLYQRSLGLYDHRLGRRSTQSASLLNDLGNLDYYGGHFDAAAARYAEALEIFNQLIPHNAYLAVVHSNLGAARRGQGRLREAVALGKTSLETARKAYWPRHPKLAELELEYAATLRAIHDYAAAREVAEDAVAIGVFAKTAPARLGDYRFELAQNVWLSGEHARARAIAVEARGDLLRAGAAGKDKMKALDLWLKAVSRFSANLN